MDQKKLGLLLHDCIQVYTQIYTSFGGISHLAINQAANQSTNHPISLQISQPINQSSKAIVRRIVGHTSVQSQLMLYLWHSAVY